MAQHPTAPKPTAARASQVEVHSTHGRIWDASRLFGVSRRRIYRLHEEGLIRLVKPSPRCTLVDFASLRGYLASLPVVEVRSGQSGAARPNAAA